jgi:glycosyltransferase involved in cell wall biosynthesis
VPNETSSVCETAVIIPCYNAGSCVARALDSVLAQTHQDYRIFVVDDGSTDDTEQVLRNYAGRVVAVRQEHAGQGSARNRGIRLSRSSYVAFLDADDEWLPTKLERQIEILRRDSSIGLIYSDCSTSGTGPFAGSHFARAGTPKGGRVFEQLLDACSVFTPTVVVRRECLEEVGLFNESLPVGEDFNLWLRIAARWAVAVVPEVLAVRHYRPGGLSLTTGPDTALRSSVVAFEHVLQSSAEHLLPDQRKALLRAIAQRHYDYGTYLLIHGERARSRDQMSQAFRDGPLDWRVPAKIALSFLPHRAFLSLRELQRRFKSAPAGNHVTAAE